MYISVARGLWGELTTLGFDEARAVGMRPKL